MKAFFTAVAKQTMALKKPNNMTPEEYVEQINFEMNENILSIEDIPPEKDDFLASVIKITHNGLWGKLLQKTPDTRIRVAESRQDFVTQYTQGNVVGIQFINGEKLAMNLIQTFNSPRLQSYTNCVLGIKMLSSLI